MKKITWKDRFYYAFDNFMAKGTISLIGGLAAISAIFILFMAIIVTILGINPPEDRWSFFEALWGTLMRTMDTGTVGGDQGWIFRLFMLFVTFGGIFIISTLIGLLTSGIENKLQDLRKGRSRIIEEDHIVILGWSFQIFTLLSELIIANANRPNSCIVILSDQDKVEMEESIQKWINFKHKIRLVCRTGNCSDLGDLGLVNIQNSRSVIILNPPSEYGDINVIKTLLAIVNIPREDDHPYHIIAQIQEEKNLEVVDLIAGDQVETLLTNDFISRIIVQTCRQSGLSSVYMDLFDFSGNEIYLSEEPSLIGQNYGKILISYEDSAVIGIKNSEGNVELNPPLDRTFQSGEQLIILAEDNDTIHISNITPQINDQLIHSITTTPSKPEKTLILGWNSRVPNIIQELDRYVASNSQITVVANFPKSETMLEETCVDVVNQTITYFQGQPTERSILQSLNLSNYDHILVICSDYLEPELIDAQTLVILLQLRHLTENYHPPKSIVSEMLDVNNQALAEVAKPDDFVISEKIISLLLAQIAEEKTLNQIFQCLLSAEGSEIYLKPITNYITIGQATNFYTIVESAKRQGESAIGYRLKADANNRAKNYGVIINPRKSDLINFSDQDKIIVLAES
jgi:ion channel POLLUX/CASTOR